MWKSNWSVRPGDNRNNKVTKVIEKMIGLRLVITPLKLFEIQKNNIKNKLRARDNHDNFFGA